MSYIIEYTTLSGKRIPILHKIFESAESAESHGRQGVAEGNYRAYAVVEAAPKMQGDSIKAQRERDREHADAMGRHVKSGRKKTYTSTQRQMAKMRGEELPEGYKVLPPMDRDRYQERPGLEGPFSTLSGKVVYYDPKEGSYYDPDTDMYLSYDEFQVLDNDYSGMKDERDIAVKEEDDERDELTKKLFPKMSPDEMKKRDQERNRAMNQQRFMKPGKPSRSREWGAYESATNVSEAMRLDRDNIILPSSGAEQFAKHYRAGMMGDHRDGGPTDKDTTNSEKFYKLYSAKDVRSGFAGSGTTEYTNNKTGETFRVNRTPNGKGFYGTDHNIEVVSGVNESVTGMKKNIIAKIKSGATRADIKKQFPQLQKDDIDGFFKNHSTTREAELDEVSDKMLDRYRQKAFVDQPSGDDGSDKYRKRKAGRDLAFDKQTGRAKVRATKEEVELDEADVYSIKNTKTGKIYHNSKYPITKNTQVYKKIKSAGGDHKHAAIHKNGKPVQDELELDEVSQALGKGEDTQESVNEANTAYEKDMDHNKIVVVRGVKGVKSTPFRKKFRNMAAYEKWSDSEAASDYEVQDVMNEDIAQDANIMERDHEVQMARSDLYKTANYAIKLHNMLKGVSEEQGIEGWMQAKITKASDYLSSVFHALEYDELERSQSEPVLAMESAERPYVAVHAKKGKTEVTGSSSYDAAKKAAAKWKLTSTAGIDVHLADVTHVATESLDKDKIQKQIDQTEKHMKSFSGNTSGVKMKKVALQKKINDLKAKLEELSETTTAGAIATAPMPMGKMIKRRKT